MAVFRLPTLLEACVGCTALLLLRRIYWELTTGASHRRIMKANNCRPAKVYPAWPFVFGLDLIIHNLKLLREHRLLEDIQQDFHRLGSTTVSQNVLMTQAYGTIEPENLKAVLATNFKSFGLAATRKDLIPFLGQGIFSSDGAKWQHSRDMLRPNFVRTQISDTHMFERHVQRLIELIPRDGANIDLQKSFSKLTLDISTELLFGESTNTLDPEVASEWGLKFAEIFDRCGDFFESVNLITLFLPSRQFKKDCKLLHSLVDDLIDKEMAKLSTSEGKLLSQDRYVFSHSLISQTQSKVEIRSELLNILVAGRDTTASTLTNVWFMIARRPDIFARLQEEIANLPPPPHRPSFEEFKNLKYLRGVVNESLRLHPILPANERQAVEDTVLPLGGGENGQDPLFVPKGAVVGWYIYAMHRRKDIYGEDAEEFRPERWMDEGEEKALRPGWAFLPFNGGPRACIGQQFALSQISYVTVRLLQEFSKVESHDPEPWRESFKLTCAGFGGCKLGLWERA